MNKDIMRQAGFEKEVMMVEHSVCPDCCKPIEDPYLLTCFRNGISRKEFEISGM